MQVIEDLATTAPHARTRTVAAMKWLQDLLEMEGELPAEGVFDLARVAGYGKGLIYRAARHLQIDKRPVPNANGIGAQYWSWRLTRHLQTVKCPTCREVFWLQVDQIHTHLPRSLSGNGTGAR